MSEILLPPWIIPSQESYQWLADGLSSFASSFAPGLSQRQSYGSPRLKLSRTHRLRLEEMGLLSQTLDLTKGGFNSLRSKIHYSHRGSFPAPELITNGTFSNGTTGWSVSTDYAVSVNDRIMRVAVARSLTSGLAAYLTTPVTVTQYAPYVARWYTIPGRGAYTSGFRIGAGSTASGNEYSSNGPYTTYGLRSYAFVPYSTTASTNLTDVGAIGPQAGDFLLVPYVSLARCILVDNTPNSVLYSGEFDNAAWTKILLTAPANNLIGPDGSLTAEAMVETTSMGTHELRQSITVPAVSGNDYTFTVVIKPNARSFLKIVMEESTGATDSAAFFNLTTGAVGTIVTGSNWQNTRAAATSLGNGWMAVSVTGRKTSTGGSVLLQIVLSTDGTTINYLGVAGDAAYVWRANFSQSSVPSLPIASSGSIVAAASQTGNGIYVKGLPASTNGILLTRDFIEINGELKRVSAPLNSDGLGLGYLQFTPELFRSPVDNDPIIVRDPMGKFLVSNFKEDNAFGLYSDSTYDLEHIYE